MIRLGLGCIFAPIIAITVAALAVWFSLTPTDKDTLGYYASMGCWSAVGLAAAAVLIAIRAWRDRVEAEKLKMTDGAFRMREERRRRWDDKLPFHLAVYSALVGEKILIDLNRTVGPVVVIDAFGNVREPEPAAGWAAQGVYNAQVEATNVARAIAQGDDSRNNWFGRDSAPARIPARTLATRQPAQLPGPTDDDIVDGTFAPVAVPFTEAVRSNTPTTFALGQSDQGVVRWDVESAPHIRVHGQTQGSGKTNVIKTIVAAAILQGVHVIILDRRGFKDWSDYRRHVEFIDNRKPGAFAGTMKQLTDIYRERDEALGQAGASNLADLPNAPARLFVVVSEFGTACREAKASGEMSEALPLLKSIMSEAGATGVHMIFEDQAINHNWPPELRGNAQPITGYLPEDAAKAGGYRLAHHLKPYHFHMEGVCFKTWDMKAEAPRLLAPVPANERTAIDVRSFVRSVPPADSAQKTQENIFTPTERTPNAPSSTDLQRMVWAWRDVNPNGTQAELRKEFSDRGIEIARSWAHECWHKWRESAVDTPLTGAEQLAAMGISLHMITDIKPTKNGAH